MQLSLYPLILPVPVRHSARVYAYHLAARLGWRWHLTTLYVPTEYAAWMMSAMVNEARGPDGKPPLEAILLREDLVTAMLED